MALPIKKRRDESTNEKIVRLFQEGQTIEQICKVIDLRYDIVEGVIKRRLGDDAVPETVVVSKLNDNNENSGIEEMESVDETETDDADGLSKLERYMLEKKKKQQGELFTNTAAPDSQRTISLVDDYINAQSNGPDYSKAKIENNEDVNTMPEINMDSIYATDKMVESVVNEEADLSDDSETVVENAEVEEIEMNSVVTSEVQEVTQAQVDDSQEDQPSKAFNKMKAFALSQIEMNNVKISELEGKMISFEDEHKARLQTASDELTASQTAYTQVEKDYIKAVEDLDNALEQHRVAVSQADADYRRKLELLDEEYKRTTDDANNKYKEYEDSARPVVDELAFAKEKASEEVTQKLIHVNDVGAKLDSVKEEVSKKINSLVEENNGYKDFLV